MENIFVDNPIIVDIVDIKSLGKSERLIKQQIVWINTFDKKIANIWDQRDIQKLKKHYKSYDNLAHLVKKGGEEINDIDSNTFGEITFDDDDFNELLEEDVDMDEKKIQKIVSVEKPYIVVKDIFIFPEDKVSDFKNKIYAATNIPPYRQHIWYEFSNKAFPIGYKVVHDVTLPVDIRSLHERSNLFEGLPVDTNWYSIKDNLAVVALDEFQLLGHIYDRHATVEYFVVDLNDFINPVRGNVEKIIKDDSYSTELIYFSFILKFWPHLTLTSFGEYIKNEQQLFEKYPSLAPNISQIKSRYRLETKIVGSNYIPNLDEKKWDVPLFVSITYSVISVTEQYIIPGSTIYLRNLFDLFELNEHINYSMCNIEFDGRPVLLVKNYKTTVVPSTKVALNALLFNINIPEHGNIHLIIHKKGTYKIESKWREDQYFSFKMVYDQIKIYVKPIIEKINSYGKLVTSNPLTIIKNDNSTFTDINVSMFWKFNMSQKMFNNVKDIFNMYTNAGIIVKNTSNISVSLDYYFVKGMHKYELSKYNMLNPVQNQFQYLTDPNVKHKHDALITKRKHINVTHRFSDIKIECSGLKEQEFITFYIYILRLLESIPRVKGDIVDTKVKKLKQLKERDPLLYEFKKVYKSDLIYSKLCQQQKQPVMYNDPGKNRIKFWNFTTGIPAYYGCPNPNYPYINFITHAHPKNFCIPCCYKLPPSTNKEDKKTKIYNTCIEKKKYEKERKSLSKSRYVMSYGKTVEVGRLSRLPENTLEPLFYDTFSSEIHGIDEECVKEKGFYLFGVPQSINNVSNIGFLFCISHSLGLNIIDFVSESITRIRKRCECWNILLGGTIYNYFPTFSAFLGELRDVFVGNKLSVFEHWNYLFIDIAKIYWNITTAHFLDESSLSHVTNIYLRIPSYIQHWDDYVSDNKHIVIIERDKQFYPVYSILKDVYFRIGTIEEKVYNRSSPFIKIIHNLAHHHIKQSKYRDSYDLHFIKKFIKNSKYNIAEQYVNSSNLCFGVLLKLIPDKKVIPFYDSAGVENSSNLDSKDYSEISEMLNRQTQKSNEKSFYIPIKESFYKADGAHISFDTPDAKNTASAGQMDLFLTAINNFVTKYSDFFRKTDKSVTLLYPLSKVENWLLLKENIVGFKCNSFNYILEPTSIKNLKMTNVSKNAKFIKLLYDPFIINKILRDKAKPTHDTRSKKLSKSLYNNYLYQILIIELINIMDKQRNSSIRKRLEQIVNKFTMANMQNKELFNLLKDYPSDHKTIQKLLFDNLTGVRERKKNPHIDLFVSKKHFSKKDILDVIENSTFMFDRKMFENFKTMPHKKLVEILMSTFSNITKDENPTFDEEFPNMIMSCEINHPYCKNKKLMIQKNKLMRLLDIMASDILNPVKSKYIFSPIFVKNTIDKFKFIVRNDEHIRILI